jgi:hypothetical protein
MDEGGNLRKPIWLVLPQHTISYFQMLLLAAAAVELEGLNGLVESPVRLEANNSDELAKCCCKVESSNATCPKAALTSGHGTMAPTRLLPPVPVEVMGWFGAATVEAVAVVAVEEDADKEAPKGKKREGATLGFVIGIVVCGVTRLVVLPLDSKFVDERRTAVPSMAPNRSPLIVAKPPPHSSM